MQRTEADEWSTLRIGAKIDDVMVPLMAALADSKIVPPNEWTPLLNARMWPRGPTIPPFVLRRRIRMRLTSPAADEAEEEGGRRLEVHAVDSDGLAADVLFNVRLPSASDLRSSQGHAAAGEAAGPAPAEGSLGDEEVQVEITTAIKRKGNGKGRGRGRGRGRGGARGGHDGKAGLGKHTHPIRLLVVVYRASLTDCL